MRVYVVFLHLYQVSSHAGIKISPPANPQVVSTRMDPPIQLNAPKARQRYYDLRACPRTPACTYSSLPLCIAGRGLRGGRLTGAVIYPPTARPSIPIKRQKILIVNHNNGPRWTRAWQSFVPLKTEEPLISLWARILFIPWCVFIRVCCYFHSLIFRVVMLDVYQSTPTRSRPVRLSRHPQTPPKPPLAPLVAPFLLYI